MTILEALFMPAAVIVAAFLLARSVERAAQTLRTERGLERAAEKDSARPRGRGQRFRKMTAIARRQGWNEADLERRIEAFLTK
jgi:hypothetical protein